MTSLTVGEVGALSNLNNVAVRIADVAANLAVLGDWRRYEFGASAFPQLVARVNICNAKVHKAVDVVWVRDAEHYRRLIRSWAAANIQNHPNVFELKVCRRVAVTQAQNASTENLFVIAGRSFDVGHGEKLRDAKTFSRWHDIGFLFDLYSAHVVLLSFPRH